MNYTIARYVRHAYAALKRAQKHIVNADAEAQVSDDPARQGIRRCRELADVLQGMLLDAKFHVEHLEHPQPQGRRIMRKMSLRRLRALAEIEDESFVSVGGLVEEVEKKARLAALSGRLKAIEKGAQKKRRSQP